jgi:hypothetical protein
VLIEASQLLLLVMAVRECRSMRLIARFSWEMSTVMPFVSNRRHKTWVWSIPRRETRSSCSTTRAQPFKSSLVGFRQEAPKLTVRKVLALPGAETIVDEELSSPQ